MKNFILGSVITFLVALCVFLYVQNTSLSASLDTYRSNKKIENKDFQKVKEDYYIEQQSNDTSLLLVVFPILLAIASVTTFAGVREEFKRNLAIQKSDYENQISEQNEGIIHINNLRSMFNLQFAEKINNDFGKVLLERPLDIPKLIELGLMSCQNYCYAIGYNSNNSEEFSSVVTKYITVTLDVMVEKVNLVEKVELKSISYAQFLAIKSSFDLTLEKDNLQKFSIIFSRLSFPTL